MGAVCVLIYTVLVLPLILRNLGIDAVAVPPSSGTGIVFVVVFTRIARERARGARRLGEANRLLRENAAQVEEWRRPKSAKPPGARDSDSLGH